MPAALSDPDSNDHDFIKRIGPLDIITFFYLKERKSKIGNTLGKTKINYSEKMA